MTSMRSTRAALGLTAFVACAFTAPSVHAAYPTAPQIVDKDATKHWNLMLSDWAFGPKSQPTQMQSSQTNNQVARLNFVRAEPVGTLAASRLFVPDLNANLLIMDRATKTFTPYLNFPSIFNGTGGTGTFD